MGEVRLDADKIGVVRRLMQGGGRKARAAAGRAPDLRRAGYGTGTSTGSPATALTRQTQCATTWRHILAPPEGAIAGG